MANISITAALVVPSADAILGSAILGEAGVAGEVVYKPASGANRGKLYLAKADAADTSIPVGILQCSGAAGQKASYVTYDPLLATGGTTVQGTIYGVSAANAGKIAPIADVTQTTTARYPTAFGIGLASNKMAVDFNKLITGIIPGTP